MDIRRLQEELMETVSRMREIQDTAAEENRELTAEENENYDRSSGEVTRLEKQIAREAELNQLEQRRVESLARNDDQLRKLPKAPQKADIPTRNAPTFTESRDLALGAYVRHKSGKPILDDQKDACRRLGLDPRSEYFDLNLMTNEEHRSHFGERRALSTVKDTTGGETVPIGFQARLEQEMWWYGGMMQAAEVWRTDSGNPVFWPTVADRALGTGCDDTPNLGRMIGAAATPYTGENVEVTDETEATYGEVQFGAMKGSSDIVRISQELMEDSAFNIGDITAAQLGERLGRLINLKTTVGLGTTEPVGIMTGACLGTTATGTNAIAADDVITLAHTVDPAYRNNGRYMFHDNTLAALRKLKTSDDWYIWQPSPLQGLQQGVTGTLYGFPYIINNDMPVIPASGGATVLPLIFGDLNRFKIRLVRNIRLRVFVEKWGTFDQTGYLAFVRFDSNHIMVSAYKTLSVVAPT